MDLIVIVWLFAALVMTAGWWWQRQHRNIGVVDMLWAACTGMAALIIATLSTDGGLWPRLMLGSLGLIWGLRLAWHLWRRLLREDEDGRYQAMRAYIDGHQGLLFAFFQFQAALVALLALPFLAVARNPVDGLTGWIVAALAMWLLSVGGEALADRQLARFRANPANAGSTCRDGLWRYSRHPNYFFEWLHWFTYVLLAIGSPLWWLSLSGPLLMYAFVRWISGVPFTEKQALRSRGEDYRDYQRSTPMLFPWFPHDAGQQQRKPAP